MCPLEIGRLREQLVWKIVGFCSVALGTPLSRARGHPPASRLHDAARGRESGHGPRPPPAPGRCHVAAQPPEQVDDRAAVVRQGVVDATRLPATVDEAGQLQLGQQGRGARRGDLHALGQVAGVGLAPSSASRRPAAVCRDAVLMMSAARRSPDEGPSGRSPVAAVLLTLPIVASWKSRAIGAPPASPPRRPAPSPSPGASRAVRSEPPDSAKFVVFRSAAIASPGSECLHDGRQHLVVERLVARQRDLPVMQEPPVAGDLEPRAGADPDVSRPIVILERDDDVALA